jgi:hypothetical protein
MLPVKPVGDDEVANNRNLRAIFGKAESLEIATMATYMLGHVGRNTPCFCAT